MADTRVILLIFSYVACLNRQVQVSAADHKSNTVRIHIGPDNKGKKKEFIMSRKH